MQPRGVQLTKVAILVLFSFLNETAGYTQEIPSQTDQFVNAVGVNVHLGYTDTLYYNNFPLVRQALGDLHIRHVRDDEPISAAPGFYTNHNSLLALGIHGEFVTQITETNTDITSYPGLFTTGYFEGFEPPNECDVTSNCGSPWASNLISFLSMLGSNKGQYPVFGPAFAGPLGAPAVGDVSSYTSFGNLHDYKGGWNPGFAGVWGFGYTNYLSTALNKSLAQTTNPNQQFVITETGYTNAVAVQNPQLGYPVGATLSIDANSVPESISAVYMPRVLLNGWLNGAKRTDLYELLSSPGQDYGLLRGDGTRKPAFSAVSNMLGLLMDPGPAFSVTPLTYTLSGGDATLRHLLLEDRHGCYYLVVWLESSIYNVSNNIATPVQAQTVTLTTVKTMKSSTSYVWQDDGSVVQSSLTPGTLTLSVGPAITIVKMGFNP